MSEQVGSIQSIVAGTDGSETAERAVTRAGELGRALGVTVHLVSAYRRATDGAWAAAGAGMGMTSLAPEDEDLARGQAEEIVTRSGRRLKDLGVEVQCHVCPGEAAEALMSVAQGESATMIVVGNRGMHGARRVLGSVPDRISHHAACEVLIVPTA